MHFTREENNVQAYVHLTDVQAYVHLTECLTGTFV